MIASFGSVTIAQAAEARLVHCGSETCLRVSGYRHNAASTVSAAGRPLAVQGRRHWHTIVPLAVARTWLGVRTDALTLTLGDARSGAVRAEPVSLPPGALGRRVVLASLVVRAD